MKGKGKTGGGGEEGLKVQVIGTEDFACGRKGSGRVRGLGRRGGRVCEGVKAGVWVAAGGLVALPSCLETGDWGGGGGLGQWEAFMCVCVASVCASVRVCVYVCVWETCFVYEEKNRLCLCQIVARRFEVTLWHVAGT